MDIVLRVSTKAPVKRDWDDPNPASRGEWSEVYETISAWFCTSHSFNTDNNLYILTDKGTIGFIGKDLRYLGPSLRSSASLVSKAYKLLENNVKNKKESTPGVMVYPSSNQLPLKMPYYHVKLSTLDTSNEIRDGTIFTFPNELAETYYVPAQRISQASVWILQRKKA